MSKYAWFHASEVRAIYRNITRIVRQLKPSETLHIRDFEMQGNIPDVYYNLRGASAHGAISLQVQGLACNAAMYSALK